MDLNLLHTLNELKLKSFELIETTKFILLFYLTLYAIYYSMVTSKSIKVCFNLMKSKFQTKYFLQVGKFQMHVVAVWPSLSSLERIMYLGRNAPYASIVKCYSSSTVKIFPIRASLLLLFHYWSLPRQCTISKLPRKE